MTSKRDIQTLIEYTLERQRIHASAGDTLDIYELDKKLNVLMDELRTKMDEEGVYNIAVNPRYD
ncbi:hypothetical protein D3C81_1633820 [compost metagenome]